MSPLSLLLDCCVHCILACLFCEFLTLCNIVLDCATCGSCAGDESCFCCCCASEECGDCDLPCDMDCGIIDACCESADCLEICMECCSLCFSSWGSSQLMRHRRCTLDIPASPGTTSTSVYWMSLLPVVHIHWRTWLHMFVTEFPKQIMSLVNSSILY